MQTETLADAAAVAQRAAEFIAAEARTAVQARGRFAFAVSGGHTPWQMLRLLATEDVPWQGFESHHLERVAGAYGYSRCCSNEGAVPLSLSAE